MRRPATGRDSHGRRDPSSAVRVLPQRRPTHSRRHHQHRTANADRRGELDAIETAITAKTAARNRYRAAFENGTMDEADAGTRLRELRTEIDALTVRRDEIADAIEDEPAAPSPATLDRIREHLARVIEDGSSAERKATIEQLIAEIRITEDDKVIPVFRVPGPDDAVRAMPRLVGLLGLEPRCLAS
jgi:site-specific DNA recombinase